MHKAVDEYFRTARVWARLLPLAVPALNAVLDAITAEAAGWEDDKVAARAMPARTEALALLLASGRARIEVVSAALRAVAAR